MMVTFVSQCEKKALNRTRRVLDAFADRIGDNTWQTVITQEGLLAVKKLLGKTATKNTAVSCHWIRSRARSELVWVVGNRNKFNSEGAVPVNSTKRDLINSNIENDWTYSQLIKALVAVAALLHDWGKASQLFQAKLNPKNKVSFKGDPIRHEWVSCLLLHALVENNKEGGELTDNAWLTALIKGEIDESKLKVTVATNEKYPLAKLPPLAKLVAWLIVSHHRLPFDKAIMDELKGEKRTTIDEVLQGITQSWGYQNGTDETDYQQRLAHCFIFPNGLLSDSKPWLFQIKKWSRRLLACQSLALQAMSDGSYRPVLSYARLCLMLGDHFYSSQIADEKWQSPISLYANTDMKTKQLKQQLDEHLVGVAKQGLKNAHLLPAFETEPPVAQGVNALKKLSPSEYRWQDKAVQQIKLWQQANHEKQGFFAVNMASTGCGKTFANAKVMQALSADGQSLRFILALGLRTLTLQTGDEYRERVGLDETELAVLIGSRAVMELHRKAPADAKTVTFEEGGSESQQLLLDEDVDYECAIPEEGMATVLRKERDKKFLYAPVLACTIDHLMAATEAHRGGRYILPTLRLMSSDLVIDEIDDFTGSDLVAIGRIIHLAGMLGRKVMISSATIPPDLAEGYFKAYRDGWLLYCKTRKAAPTVGCAWIDEFNTSVITNKGLEVKDAIPDYRQSHVTFIEKRAAKLRKQVVKRKADIRPCEQIFADFTQHHNDDEVITSKQQAYFKIVLDSALVKHAHHHSIDSQTQLSVSFGVVRVANIQPCVALTKYLLTAEIPADTEIRTMPYHSQQVLLLRHLQEQHLDAVLKRKETEGEPPKAFLNSDIRQHLKDIRQSQPQVKQVLFILVATPVEEVGRDHDFDWAVVEPSSYRSIVQLAGRVRRHRNTAIEQSNVTLMQYNWRGIKTAHRDDAKVFCWPGFEGDGSERLESHNLNDLVDAEALLERVDAIPRIQKSSNLQPTKKLVDLEHCVTKKLLATYNNNGNGPAQLQGYLREAWFLTAYPQKLVRFRSGQESENIFLIFDAGIGVYKFCIKDEQGFAVPYELPLGITQERLEAELSKRLWLQRDYDEAIDSLADELDLTKRRASLRYGELSFRHDEGARYEYNDQFGLVEI